MDDKAKKEIAFYEELMDKGMKAIAEQNQWATPTKLSNSIVKLAWANSMYGRYLSTAQVLYRTVRKQTFEQQLKDGAPVTRAKEEAKNAALELEGQYDHMYNLHQDTKDFITVCMSYLKIMGIEVRLNNM